MDLWKYKGLDWLAMALTATSLYFLAKQRKRGFVIGVIGNVFWILFGVMAESVGNVFASCVYMGFQIHGWRQWKAKPPQGQN